MLLPLNRVDEEDDFQLRQVQRSIPQRPDLDPIKNIPPKHRHETAYFIEDLLSYGLKIPRT